MVGDDELARRRAANPIAPPSAERGYRKLFLESVLPADKGADFDFLRSSQSLGVVPSR